MRADEAALEIAQAKEKHVQDLLRGATGDLDPAIRVTCTIAEYEPIFLRHRRVEGNTRDTYKNTLRLYVIPFLGRIRLAETTRTTPRNFFTALEEAGRSPNTIRQAKVVLAAIDPGVIEMLTPSVYIELEVRGRVAMRITVSPVIPAQR